MEFIIKNIGKIALTVFGFLAVFDVVGVVLCWFLDIIHDISMAEYYTLWFVLAVFCGMLSYMTAADMVTPKTPENDGRAGLLIVFSTFLIVASVSFGSYMIWWRDGGADGPSVPDNEPLSITFLVTVLASSLLAYKTMRPDSVRRSGGSKRMGVEKRKSKPGSQ